LPSGEPAEPGASGVSSGAVGPRSRAWSSGLLPGFVGVVAEGD
jgi:hypothetical protein